ncbi:signal peptidase I [Quadrisphaera sp. DSM 44207]|uniref:signal peptidase I n=1 Tax=Quadrisphaera sp. DSM 44207 TaxID=1881057 RepID=UPI0008862AAF|nr:signal peptidase I [Quadrisphaera sp. DSM 44207]SDQ76046.1 signal peptidase I [Quadrisphaera sp. DSM 44207]
MTEHAPAHSRRRSGGLLPALRETVVVLVAALVLSLLVKTFIGQAFFIPSISMEQTLLVGDRVLVSKLTPGPFDLERGDIVVFKDPGGWLDPVAEPQRGPVGAAVAAVLTFVGILPQDSGEHLVKRVIGLPGDEVACCDEQGRVTVNGEPLEEVYISEGDAPSELDFSVQVPQDRLWVMGDHRAASEDSRYHLDLAGSGTVPVENVVGRAALLVWPLSRLGGLSEHAEVFEGVPAAPALQASPAS